jgi:hypothetical protein
MSARPSSRSMLNRNSVAHACTGGFTSLKFDSYAGIPRMTEIHDTRRSSEHTSWRVLVHPETCLLEPRLGRMIGYC